MAKLIILIRGEFRLQPIKRYISNYITGNVYFQEPLKDALQNLFHLHYLLSVAVICSILRAQTPHFVISFPNHLTNCWLVAFLHWVSHIFIPGICVGGRTVTGLRSNHWSIWAPVRLYLFSLWTAWQGRCSIVIFIFWFEWMCPRQVHLRFVYVFITWDDNIHVYPMNIKSWNFMIFEMNA